MKKRNILGLSFVSILALTACGGGSSSGDDGKTGDVKTGTAYYLDSAVSGVKYKCGDQEGLTGTDGSFTFEEGESCTFTLAGIELRNVDASKLTDGAKILEDNVNVAQFLQSLDKDGNATNGITISPEIVQVLSTGDVAKLPENEEELKNVVKLLEDAKNSGHVEYSGHAVTPAQAAAHLDDTKGEIVAEGKTFTFPSKFYGEIKKDYNGGDSYKFEADSFNFSADKKFSFAELAFEGDAFVLDEDDNKESFHFKNGQWVKDNNSMSVVVSDNNKVVTLNDTYELTLKSLKDLKGKSRSIRDSDISVVMPEGAEETKFGFKVLKESYGIDEKARTHGHTGSDYYQSLSSVIENQCGTHYFRHAKDNSGIKGISFTCNQESQTSGTMVGVKSDNTLVTSNVGSWEIKSLPNSTEKAILITINKKYKKHSDTPLFATKDGEVWEGWRDTAGEQEPMTMYNQKAFDALTAKIVEINGNSSSPIGSLGDLVGKTLYQHVKHNGQTAISEITVQADGRLKIIEFGNTEFLPYRTAGNTLYTTDDGQEKAHTVLEHTDKYVKFNDGGSETSTFYYTRADAEAASIKEIGEGSDTEARPTQFSKEWLNGKTFYDVYQDCDNYENRKCVDTTATWKMSTISFTKTNMHGEEGSESMDISYTITDKGYISAQKPAEWDEGTGYFNIGVAERTDEYLKLCWADADGMESCFRNGGDEEYFFFNQQAAMSFLNQKN